MYDLDAKPSEETLATLRPEVANNWRVFSTALPDFKALPDLSDICFYILCNAGNGFRFEPDAGQFEHSDPETPWNTIDEAFTYLIKNRDTDEAFDIYIRFLEKYAHPHIELLRAKVNKPEAQQQY